MQKQLLRPVLSAFPVSCVILLNKKQSILTVFHNGDYKTGFDIISYVMGQNYFP